MRDFDLERRLLLTSFLSFFGLAVILSLSASLPLPFCSSLAGLEGEREEGFLLDLLRRRFFFWARPLRSLDRSERPRPFLGRSRVRFARLLERCALRLRLPRFARPDFRPVADLSRDFRRRRDVERLPRRRSRPERLRLGEAFPNS